MIESSGRFHDHVEKETDQMCIFTVYIYITYIYIHNYTYTYTIVYMLMIKSVAGLGETQVMRGRGWRRAQPTASNTPKVNPETTRV